MKMDMEDLENFQKDVYEYIDIFDLAVLDLEKDINQKESINKLFRTVHTLKSMFGMAEFDNIFELLHELEDFMEQIRSKTIEINTKIVDYLLVVHDFLLKSVEIVLLEKTDRKIDTSNIRTRLELFCKKKEEQELKYIENKMIISDYDLLEIDKKIAEGKKLYIIEINFDTKVEFNLMRVYLFLKLINAETKVFKINYELDDIDISKNIKIEHVKAIFEYENKIDSINVKFKGVGDIKSYFCKNIGKTEILDMKIQRQYDIDEDTGVFLDEFLFDIGEECDGISQKVIELDFEKNRKASYFEVYKNFHTIKGLAGISNQIHIRKLANKMETLINGLKTDKEINGETFIDIVLKMVFFIKKICKNSDLNFKRSFLNELDSFFDEFDIKTKVNKEKKKKIGEILKETKNLDEEDIIDLLMIQKEKYPTLKLGEIALKEKKISYEEMQRALDTQSSMKKRTHIKISTDMIDELSEVTSGIMSEMWNLKNMDSEDGHYLEIERLTIKLGELARNMRKVNLETLFHRLKRVARDASAKLNKNIDFQFIGKEESIDREYEEALYAPITHMLKNAISHGIENSEEERLEKSKDRVGKVQIEIKEDHGIIDIVISDDGKGIDLQKIFTKALEKGILKEHETYSKKEILNIIFTPGFSTVEEVNGISGRGVGMDIVKSDLEKIGAGIKIDSMLDEGTKIFIKIIT